MTTKERILNIASSLDSLVDMHLESSTVEGKSVIKIYTEGLVKIANELDN